MHTYSDVIQTALNDESVKAHLLASLGKSGLPVDALIFTVAVHGLGSGAPLRYDIGWQPRSEFIEDNPESVDSLRRNAEKLRGQVVVFVELVNVQVPVVLAWLTMGALEQAGPKN